MVPVSAMQMPRVDQSEFFDRSSKALSARVKYLVQLPRTSKDVADSNERHLVPLMLRPNHTCVRALISNGRRASCVCVRARARARVCACA